MQWRIRPSLFGGALAMLLISAAVGASAALAKPTATYSVTASNDNASTPNGCRITVVASWAHSIPVKSLQLFDSPPLTDNGKVYALIRAEKKGTFTVFDFAPSGTTYHVTMNFRDGTGSQVGSATSSDISVTC